MENHINFCIQNNIVLEKQIGNGSYGEVFKGHFKKGGEKIAIKTLNKEKMNQQGDEMKQYLENAFYRELEAMKKCYCENSVLFYNNFENKDYYYIIMELCDNDLSNELKKRRKGFSAKEIKSIMSQLNNAFKKMDDNEIIHRDLKIENILIKYKDETKKDFIPKLCDYGFSKILKENDLTFTGLGTASTKAPEIWEGELYNSKVDLWSVGVIIYQLHFKDLPYKGNNEKELYKQIKENVPYKKSEDLILRDLLDHLLVKDPSKRYSWEDYFNHPFFKEEKTKK